MKEQTEEIKRIRKYRTNPKYKMWLKEYDSQRHRIEKINLKVEMFARLGSACNCCGESIKQFLTLDHVNGNPPKLHNKKRRVPKKDALKAAQKDNWDKLKYQMLCFNCNCGRVLNNGVCPHKMEVK